MAIDPTPRTTTRRLAGLDQRAAERVVALLRRLDERLTGALEVARGLRPANDPFRGLYLSGDELAAELEQPPAGPRLYADTGPWPGSPLPAECGLEPFDADLLLLAVAPELDLRYGRVLAYLQDDVARTRPTVALALDVLCPSPAARIASRRRFAADAPLRRHRLVELMQDPGRPGSLLASAVVADERVVRHLLGDEGVDERLLGAVRVVAPAGDGDGPPEALATATRHTDVVHLGGTPGCGQRRAAEALAVRLGRRLLHVDLAALPPDGLRECAGLALREALLLGAVALLEADGLDAGALRSVRSALDGAAGPVLVAGAESLAGPDEPVIAFAAPGARARRVAWQAALARERAGRVAVGTLDALAARFRLSEAQIDAAAQRAAGTARRRTGAPRPSRAELFAAARAQSAPDLGALATKVEPAFGWRDIVLRDETREQLEELCRFAAHRSRVLEEWGLARGPGHGEGLIALFAGPSGTGKSMAAEVVARDLGLDLFRIELARVVSKYVGETEKHLEAIFTAAEAANAVLLFDEADALFGRRSEVRDSHDRYANVEISYLLQRLESYAGIALLTTNLSAHLDEAFLRRLTFTIHFPFPTEAERRLIWERVWPAATPVEENLDTARLAGALRFSGSNIRNAAVAAAYLAASDGGVVGPEHVLQGSHRELHKLGKAPAPGDAA